MIKFAAVLIFAASVFSVSLASIAPAADAVKARHAAIAEIVAE